MSLDSRSASAELIKKSAALVAALRNPRVYPHPVDRIEVIETHISWVVLTGQYAYKIKKPVSLGFLDFSTLEKRLACCREELRLNRRLAPNLYLEVTAITGSIEEPRVGGNDAPIEFAVKMVQFDQPLLASRLLKNGVLTEQHVEQLAATIANFHSTASTRRMPDASGSTQNILLTAMQNFDQIEALPGAREDVVALDGLQAWTRHEFDERHNRFETRLRENRMRECHGDLHLGNIALIDGTLTPFDCIEFNAALRWIDVASEAAFLAMDLIDRGRPDFAFLFLSIYLELTGDYEAVQVLRFYLVYRAMVRAKVHCLRAHQLPVDSAERRRLLDAYRGYLALAASFTRPPRASLVVLHGLSGSGKSTVSQPLLQALPGIRIRSDVERKRMHDVGAFQRVAVGVESGIYSAESTERVYRRLAQLAGETTRSGFTTIVDAAFLKRWQRDLLRDRAREVGVPFIIVSVQCPERLLKTRIACRRNTGQEASDADLTVLSHQIAHQDPIAASERDDVVTLDGALPFEAVSSTSAWRNLISRTRGRIS